MDRVLYDASTSEEQIFLMDDSIFYKDTNDDNDGFVIPLTAISLIDYNQKNNIITITYFDDSTATVDYENVTISSLNSVLLSEFSTSLKSALSRHGYSNADFFEINNSGFITQLFFFVAFGVWCYFNPDIRTIIILAAGAILWIAYRIWIYKKKPISHKLFYKDLGDIPANMKRIRITKNK